MIPTLPDMGTKMDDFNYTQPLNQGSKYGKPVDLDALWNEIAGADPQVETTDETEQLYNYSVRDTGKIWNNAVLPNDGTDLESLMYFDYSPTAPDLISPSERSPAIVQGSGATVMGAQQYTPPLSGYGPPSDGSASDLYDNDQLTNDLNSILPHTPTIGSNNEVGIYGVPDIMDYGQMPGSSLYSEPLSFQSVPRPLPMPSGMSGRLVLRPASRMAKRTQLKNKTVSLPTPAFAADNKDAGSFLFMNFRKRGAWTRNKTKPKK